MRKLQNLLVLPIIPGVFSNQFSLGKDSDLFGIGSHCDLLPHIFYGNRIIVSGESDNRKGRYPADCCFACIKRADRQWAETFLVFQEQILYGTLPTRDFMRIRIHLAFIQQEFVQFIQRIHSGYGDEDIPANPAYEIFHQPFFISAADIAENSMEAIMSSKCFILFLGDSFFATFFLDCYPVIIKNDLGRDTTEKFQCLSQCLKKGFCILSAKTDYERSTAVAKAGTKEIDLRPHSFEIHHSFSPIDLHCITWKVGQGDKSFLEIATQLMDTAPDSAYTSCESGFFHQAVINPFGRMVLLLIGFLRVFIQTSLDELRHLLCNHCRCPMIFAADARERIPLAILGHSITRDMHFPGNLANGFSITNVHLPNLTIIFHSDDHPNINPLRIKLLILV